MTFIQKGSQECISQELQIFELPPTDTAYIDTPRYHIEQPVTSIGSGSTIDYVIKSSIEDYVDLSNSYIDMTLSINKSNGDAIATHVDADTATAAANATAKAKTTYYPENYLIGCLFKNVEFYINNTLISNSDNLYPYRAYLETLLNSSDGVKNDALQLSMYFREEGNPDFRNGKALAGIAGHAVENYSALKRYEKTKDSTKFQLIGKIHCDIFNQTRLIPGKNELKLKFFRSNPEFCIRRVTENDTDDVAYTIKIDSMNLLIRKCEISSHLREAHEKQLLSMRSETYKFPYSETRMRQYLFNTSQLMLSEPNLVTGVLPSRLIFGLVEADALNGSYEKNPFKFEPCNVTSVVLRKNGVAIPHDQLSLDFTNNNFLSGYLSLLQTSGCDLTGNNSLGITPEMYKTSHCLYAFDLTNPKHGCLPLIESGKISLDIRLSPNANNKAVALVVYMQFESVLHIGSDGLVTLSNQEGTTQ